MPHHTQCMNCHEPIHSVGKMFVHDESGSPYCGVTIVESVSGDEGWLLRFMRALGFTYRNRAHTVVDERYQGSQAIPREWVPHR